MGTSVEKELQQKYEFAREVHFDEYNAILAYYQSKTCIENSPQRGSALDMPCGDGVLTEIFSKNFERMVGIDASKKHLAAARRRLPNVEFHEALIEEVELEEKFDAIFMINVLEHVLDPVESLKKAASLLSSEGVLHVHVPNANAINRKIAVEMGTLTHCEELSPWDVNVAGHRRAYSLETLVQDIEKAELSVIKTGGVFYKMLSTPQIDWFLKNGLWEKGGHGWGRVGEDKKDWKRLFCDACYVIGKDRPEDCNVIYACIKVGV